MDPSSLTSPSSSSGQLLISTSSCCLKTQSSWMFTPVTVWRKNNWPQENKLIQNQWQIWLTLRKWSPKKWVPDAIAPKANAVKIIANASGREGNAQRSAVAQTAQMTMNMSLRRNRGQVRVGAVTVGRLTARKSTVSVTQEEWNVHKSATVWVARTQSSRKRRITVVKKILLW